MGIPAQDSRQIVLSAAAALFFREGYRAVGIDTIVSASGVAKMTLYRHFPSKDDLIAAYLTEMDRQFWEWFEAVTREHEGDPKRQILEFFGSMENLHATPHCYGCPFLNAIVDFPDVDHPAHRIAVEHKSGVRERFRAISNEAGAPDPKAAGDHLYLLMDGSFMAVRMFGAENPGRTVRSAVQVLVDSWSLSGDGG